MMPIALHTPETTAAAKPVRAVRRSGRRHGRPIDKARVVAIVGVGAAIIGGFAGAMTLMSGLAAPPPRAVMAMNTRAAEWPDLRDGVPALSRPEAAPRSQTADASGDSAPVPVVAPATLRTALDPVVPPVAAMPVAKTASGSRKPTGTLPQIENAALVAPAREAALLVQPRSAAILRPLASETVRARTAAASTFASLEPEDGTASVAVPAREPAAKEPAKPRAKVASAKPARAAAPAAQAAVASAAEPEADDTEVLGMKIPSLASAGRKLRDAFGGGATAAAE